MYKQSIKNIKAVIIPLDGTILDLNRFRYNYYHHLCSDKNVDLTKQEFYSRLSNMYDMYKGLPLSSRVDTGPLNAKIEREMLQYLQYKGIKPKEGFLELLEWFLQKGIQVAVISTHRTKDAVNYLQMTNLYNKVHYIIGSDTVSLPLPSSQMLKNVVDFFQVQSEEVLVLSSFMALNYAANEMHMNIIYCQDLMKPDSREQETSYKVVSNLFEVLNSLLFDRYNEVEMYAPILGMSEQMGKQELDSVREKLHSSYQNDPQLINIVDQTYEYRISQLNQTSQIKNVVSQPKASRFHFKDESSINEVDETQNEIPEEVIEERVETKKDDSTAKHAKSLDIEDQETLTLLLNQINKQDIQKVETPKVTDFNEIKDIVVASHTDENTEKKLPLFISLIVNMLYTAAISLLILFIGLIVYIAFIHQFQSDNGIFNIISELFNVYYTFIEYIFKFILDGLNNFIGFIPTYQDYLTNNAIISSDGIKLFNIFLFHFLVIGFVKTIIFFSTRGSHNEIDF